MTNFGDLLGDLADKLTQTSINIGDVHLLNLDQNNGITPKSGDTTRNKFFIVLGFDNEGNVIGGLVINSKINYKLPPIGHGLSITCICTTIPIFRAQLFHQLLKNYCSKEK